MPPPVILAPSTLNLSEIVAGADEIRRCNPQRFEFQLLDAIVLCDLNTGIVAGYHDVREDGFWARGHIPGRPLFPGVLMIEVAAQLASFIHRQHFKTDQFLGFAGVDAVKFRGAVAPPARFVVVGRAKSVKPRRTICDVQGFLGDEMVFEGEITGMPI